MAVTGRPKENIYDKYVKGKEETILALCRNGADNKIIAQHLGCGTTTLKKLLKTYPDFKKMILSSKEVADLAVESALYRRALGYDYEETITEVNVSKDGSTSTTTVRKIKKHVVPDTLACFGWLRHRKKEEWNAAEREAPKGDITVTLDLGALEHEDEKE